jgi:hypothetical protein
VFVHLEVLLLFHDVIIIRFLFFKNFLVDQIIAVTNMSHPVNVSESHQTIDISSEDIALNRDIIVDIDLPQNRSPVLVAAEQYNNGSKLAILTALSPVNAVFISIFDNPIIATTEFIFIGMFCFSV